MIENMNEDSIHEVIRQVERKAKGDSECQVELADRLEKLEMVR